MSIEMQVAASARCIEREHGACDGYTAGADYCECWCHTESSAAPYDWSDNMNMDDADQRTLADFQPE